MKTKPCSHQTIVGVQRICKACWVFGVRPGWLQWLSPSYPGTKAPQSVCAQLGLGRKNFYSNTGCRRVVGMRETRPWEPSEPTLTLGWAAGGLHSPETVFSSGHEHLTASELWSKPACQRGGSCRKWWLSIGCKLRGPVAQFALRWECQSPRGGNQQRPVIN